nr:MAG TPA: hypothetical protein [Caudoviricetes sp.]
MDKRDYLQAYYELCKLYFLTLDKKLEQDIIKLEKDIVRIYKVCGRTLAKTYTRAYKDISSTVFVYGRGAKDCLSR